MKLKLIQLDEIWPEGLELVELRLFLLEQINKHGEPLRWSLTAIDQAGDDSNLRTMRLEAVVINSDQR